MSQAPRLQPVAAELPGDLRSLSAAVERLPSAQREVIAPLLGTVIESSQRRHRILNLVQEALSQLRLDMKYLVFDLEATRRERDEFKRQLQAGLE